MLALSIHPSIISCLSEVWSQREPVQEGNPDIPLPSHTFQLLLGDPEAIPEQRGHIIPPASHGSAPGPPPSRMCSENLQREATRRHPNLMPKPPQLTPFDAEEQWLYSEFPPIDQAPILATCIRKLILSLTTQIL